MHISQSPILSITIFTVEFENNQTITLVELRGRAHEAALKAIAKSKTSANFVFKKNNEFLISRDLNRSNMKVQIANDKGLTADLSARVREISDEEFEEIKTSAALYFKNLNEEKRQEDKKEPHKDMPSKLENNKNGGDKSKARANAKEYFEEHMKKEAGNTEKKAQDNKTERIKRFEERMAERDKKIDEFKRSRKH